MFCHLRDMDTDTELCLRSSGYTRKPMVFSLLLRYYNHATTLKDLYAIESR